MQLGTVRVHLSLPMRQNTFHRLPRLGLILCQNLVRPFLRLRQLGLKLCLGILGNAVCNFFNPVHPHALLSARLDNYKLLSIRKDASRHKIA